MYPRPATSLREGAGRPLTVTEKTIPTVALLPDEPACAISTHTAGAVEFTATLTWQSAHDTPKNHIIHSIPVFDGYVARAMLRESVDMGRVSRRVSGEILALTEEDLGVAVDAALRAVGEAAALSEAVMETRVVWLAPPREVPARLVERLGRDLSESGFEVSFAPVWSVTNGADLSVGSGGMREELEDFLVRRADWRISDCSR